MPGFFYFFLKSGGVNQYVSLPFYGTVTQEGQLPVAVPSIPQMNVNGEEVLVPFQDSTLSVVNFFYTQCPQFCGRMNAEVLYLADRFSKSQLLNFYSLSLDASDTPEDLQDYIQSNGFRRDNWHFFTGEEGGIALLSRNRYMLDALVDSTQETSIIHTPMLVLLDADNHIRGYYDSTNKKEVERLQDELMVLLAETRRNNSNHDINR